MLMNISARVQRKIKSYSPKGGLDQTAKIVLSIAGINHPQVKGHNERVALLAEVVAQKLRKDSKAAFFGGLLHDLGKITEPCDLFDGHDITAEQYALVKKHVFEGFKALKDHHLFVAYCAGLHHSVCFGGYGLKAIDFPKKWHQGTVKKILEISCIIGICDFIDAFTHRTTKIKDGSDSNSPDLKTMLYKKYPEDQEAIDLALEFNLKLGLDKA
jgi:putative nucleotidyltransferase with HDIG domain